MARARKPTESNATAQKIVKNRSRVAELPGPGQYWKWHDARTVVGQSLLQRLESDGLVVRVDDAPGWWRTTERLAEYMQATHGVTLTGAVSRQETLSGDAPVTRRVNAGSESSSRGKQVTFTGETADVDDEDELTRIEYTPAGEFDGQKSLDGIQDWLPSD
jgi:hypothetical protein